MPDATVAAIITKKENSREKVLLTLRKVNPFKDFWCLPGGHIDKNELVEQAIIREVQEETGLLFKGKFFTSEAEGVDGDRNALECGLGLRLEAPNQVGVLLQNGKDHIESCFLRRTK